MSSVFFDPDRHPIVNVKDDEAVDFIKEHMLITYGLGTECCTLYMLGETCECGGPRVACN